jgi:integrase
MSVYRKRRNGKLSRFYYYEFSLEGHIFSGSTRCEHQSQAQEFEEQERARQREFAKQARDAGRKPMTIAIAGKRWWDEHGRFLDEGGMKRHVDWLIAQLGPKTALHNISDDDVSRLIALRRQDVKRSGRDEKGRPLFRPISSRTVNNTVPVLLRRIMNRAVENWSVALPRQPKWKKLKLDEQRTFVGPMREITAGEEATLDTVETADHALVRRFALIHGLRKRECLLTWPQIDFELGVFRVVQKGKKPRVVPMTRESYQLLWSQRGNDPLWVFTFVAQRTRVCPRTKRRQIKDTRYPITYSGLTSRHRRTWAAAHRVLPIPWRHLGQRG